MLGAIIGDIVGSVYEFDNHKSKEFSFFAPKSRFTDDSVMTIAVAQALLDCNGDYARLAERTTERMREFGRKYPRAGYGGMFRKWLKTPNPKPYNSFGNGSAMRVSACGFMGKDEEEVKRLARITASVTHNHPEGIKGAVLTALCIFWARNRMNKEEIREKVISGFYPLGKTVDQIRPTYEYDVTCKGSVPPAVQCFLEGTGFEDAIRNAISIGGDSDTLGAITGGMAQARWGIPSDIRERAVKYLDDRLLDVLVKFEETCGTCK